MTYVQATNYMYVLQCDLLTCHNDKVSDKMI